MFFPEFFIKLTKRILNMSFKLELRIQLYNESKVVSENYLPEILLDLKLFLFYFIIAEYG